MLRLALAAALTAAPAEAPQFPYAPLDPDETVTTPAAPAADADADETHNPPWLQYVLLDRMEWAFARGEDGYAWDFSSMVGGKRNRVYLASTAEGAASGRLDYLELEALY